MLGEVEQLRVSRRPPVRGAAALPFREWVYFAAIWRILDGMHMAGERWRLGHRPGLDGLRGVAVLLVIAYHVAGPQLPTAGIVGVTVFFALSGFLITSLLLEERERDESVSLRGFYRRRALRLFPALAAMLAIGGALCIASGRNAPSDLLVAFYSANWWQATGNDLGFLTHTWTLASEEQFYLIWPAVFLVVRRARRPLVWVAGAAVVLVTGRLVVEAVGASENFVYYTGGDALIAGCAVAFWMHGRQHRAVVPRWAVPAALVVVVAACWVPGSTGFRMAVCAVVATGVVALLALSDADMPVLGWAPLRAIGRRSYGLYLWHVPIIAVVWRFGVAAGLPFWVFMSIAMAVLAGVTELSWRYVEQPFLRLRRRSYKVTQASPQAAAA